MARVRARSTRGSADSLALRTVNKINSVAARATRGLARVLRTLALPLVLCAGPAAVAQEGQPSSEQLELFKNLPPEQQEALLAEYARSREKSGEPASERAPGRELGGERPPDDTRAKRRLTPLAAGEGYETQGLPRLAAAASVIIDLKPQREGEADEELTPLRDRILRGNPYQLDRFGRIQLPGFEPLPLLGLTEELAAKRLASDPELSAFAIRVTMLPLEPIGEEALEPFGYDLFTDSPSTFAPVTDVPVPSDYVVGAGDVLRVQLFGNVNRSFSLEVGRDGQVSFPQIGPIAVGGTRFADVKDDLEARVSEQMIGVRANVEMGETRSIRIFLLGEVPQPGSYTVSGLSTVTSALFAGGGINRVGSLRNVQLKRSGRVVKALDLYDLLLRGDTSGDAPLLPGDVVFIPTVGAVVAVSGEVLRPALYEIEPGATVVEAILLSGGLTPKADAHEARLERINERGERAVTNVDLSSLAARSQRLQKGRPA